MRAIRRIRGRLCTKGLALGETLGLETRLLHPMLRAVGRRCCAPRWDDALSSRRRRLPPHRRARRARRRRVLSLRPASDRGLLRRQQADEGLHRLGQCRHQFAAVHGVRGRRAPPRLRRRHGARRLCRSGRGRSDRSRRIEHRLVSPGALPAHGGEQTRTRREDRRDRSAPHGDGGGGRSVSFRRTGHGYGALRRIAACISPRQGALDRDYIDAHTTGFGDALARSREIAPDVAATAAATGLDAQRRRRLLRSVRATRERVVTCFSQGVNQSAQGTDKINAIINCHLATGRIGKPGAGPFSLTGQPNAMGGREVGGLANQLAAHMDFSPDSCRPRSALLERAAHGDARRAQGRPDVRRDRARRDQGPVGHGDQSRGVLAARRRHAQRTAKARAVRGVRKRAIERHDPCGRSRAVAGRRVGREGRDGHKFRTPHLAAAGVPPAAGRGEARLVDRLRSGAASRFRAMRSPIAMQPTSFASTRRCPPSRTKARAISISARWRRCPDEATTRSSPCNGRCQKERLATAAEKRFFAKGGSTPPTAARVSSRPRQPAPKEATSSEFRFRLNTGRIRDQWHTMTRTGLSARLAGHCPEPFVEIHPQDADAGRP